MRIARRTLLGALSALPLAGHAQTPRPYRMGTTLWPPELTLTGIARVSRFVQDHCDMAAPMVLGGVPWVAALGGEPFSEQLQGELTWVAPPGHKVALSLGALDTARSGLAALYAETNDQPLPPDWAALPFDAPQVIEAYGAYCVRAARAMRPDWLFIGVEDNLLLLFRPDLWPAYRRLMEATRARLRAEVPGQKIGFSIQAMAYLGLMEGPGIEPQRAEMLAFAQGADIVGWSVYPHTSWEVDWPLSPGFFDIITDFGAATGLPQAVTESGMTSAPVWLGWVRLGGDPDQQAQAMEAMLTAAEAGRWEFVVNWTSHDYPVLLEMFPPEARDLGSVWVWTGLVGPQGEAKPVLAVWDAALARPVERP